MQFTVGMDVGSAAVKVVAFGADRPLARLQEPTSPSISRQCARLLDDLLKAPALCGAGMLAVCTTGYGRNLVDAANVQVSEILANALGAGWMWRNWDRLGSDSVGFGGPPHPARVAEPFRTIVDIGGQDSKVITFTPDGLVDQFAMNDRCAAGTGRFLEMLAVQLGVSLGALEPLVQRSRTPAAINSTCVVFAESEIVGLLASGVSLEDILAGVETAIATRIAAMTGGSLTEPILFTGGVAMVPGMGAALSAVLGRPVRIAPQPQCTCALGAALLAAERTR